VSVNTQNSSLKDILAELGKKFNLQLESSANLDKQLTGNYQGSLQHVVSRLLEGYNYIIRADEAGLDVTVFGAQSAPFTLVAGNGVTGVAAKPAPTATKVQAHTAATTTSTPAASAATPHGAEVHPVVPKILSPAPASILRVAEGPSPSPAPPATSMNGLVPGPATGTMPKPIQSTETMPMPVGAPTPFPMVSRTNTSAPSATSATASTPLTPPSRTPKPQTPTTK
jgi:hypothetical protein